MEWATFSVKRNRRVSAQFREAYEMYSEYRKAYRRWLIAFHKRDSSKLKDLELKRDACARRASKASYEAASALEVLAWHWTFEE